MTDVPDIPLEQIQQRVVAMWMGSFYGSSGYVARKLGKKGLREFQDIGARQVAATFKQLGLAEPEMWPWPWLPMTRTSSEAWLRLSEQDGFVEIRRHRCGLMEGAKSFARVGASLIAKEHCKTCVESHWQKVFSELKMKLEVEHTEDGCIMRISKQ